MLEPFQKMLQFALQPLLLYVDPIADQPGDALLLKLNASCSYAFHPDVGITPCKCAVMYAC